MVIECDHGRLSPCLCSPPPQPAEAGRTALIPAALLSAVGVWLLWGDSGLMARSALRTQLAKANSDSAAVERENQRLVRELAILYCDPRAVERDVADQIGSGSPRQHDLPVRLRPRPVTTPS